MYIVLETFDDAVLGSRRPKGSLYPPPGVSVTEERLEMLVGADNALGRPFIAPLPPEEPKPAKEPKAAESEKKPAKEPKGGE